MKLWEAFKAVSEGKEVEYRKKGTKDWVPSNCFTENRWWTKEEEIFEFRLKPREPEVIEFECRWINEARAAIGRHELKNLKPDFVTPDIAAKLEGKKTKVRVEVLDEEAK